MWVLFPIKMIIVHLRRCDFTLGPRDKSHASSTWSKMNLMNFPEATDKDNVDYYHSYDRTSEQHNEITGNSF